MILSYGPPWLTAAALTFWTLVTLLFDAVAALMFAGRMEGGSELALFFVLFMLPFNSIAVGSWAALIAARRDHRSAAGVGRPKHTRDRWEVALPGDAGVAVGMVLFILPILGVFALVFGSLSALRTFPPPWWGTLAVLALATVVALWVHRRWGFRPVVVIDEKRETVTFRLRRGEDGETVLWSAVKTIDVVERTTSTEDGVVITGYDVRIKLEGKGGTRFVSLSGRGEREPVERFVRWLWERIRRTDKGGSPTAPRVN